MCLVFTVGTADDGTTGTETTAKRHQLANSDDNVLVEELAGIFRFFVIVQGVIKGHEQTEAGRVNVLAGDHLLFHKSLFPDVFIGTIRYDIYYQFHCLTFHGLGSIDGLFPDAAEGGRKLLLGMGLPTKALIPVAGKADCLLVLFIMLY